MILCQDLRQQPISENTLQNEDQGQQFLQEGKHKGGQGPVLVKRETNKKNLNQPLLSQMSELVMTKTWEGRGTGRLCLRVLGQKPPDINPQTKTPWTKTPLANNLPDKNPPEKTFFSEIL